MLKCKNLLVVFLLLLSASINVLQGQIKLERNLNDVYIALDQLLKHNKNVSIEVLSETSGSNEVIAFSYVTNPASPTILVIANTSGKIPFATYGAEQLANYICANPDSLNGYNMTIVPCLNPVAADAWSAKLKQEMCGNGTLVNNDLDEAIDEDNAEDLNADGFISLMRVADTQGKYSISKEDKRLMTLIEGAVKPEDRFNLFTEGIDNDKDGMYNEDGKDGVQIGISFPQGFDVSKVENGVWTGSEPETFGLMEYVYKHPEITMVVVLDEFDSMRKKYKATSSPTKVKTYKIPANYAKYFGLNASTSFPVSDLIEIFNEAMPGRNFDEAMVLAIVDKKPVTVIMPEDVNLYSALSIDFKKHIQAQGFKYNFVDPKQSSAGSVAQWSYFHLGVPTIELCLWDIPDLRTDSIKKASKKSLNRDAAFLTYSDSMLNGEGFLDWIPYNHAELGYVEIGGRKPYLEHMPPSDIFNDVLKKQLSWIPELTKWLPKLSLRLVKLENLGNGYYDFELEVENSGMSSAPIKMGQRNGQPQTILLIAEKQNGLKFLDGKMRTKVGTVNAGGIKRFRFVVDASYLTSLKFSLESAVIKNQSLTVNLNQ